MTWRTDKASLTCLNGVLRDLLKVLILEVAPMSHSIVRFHVRNNFNSM